MSQFCLARQRFTLTLKVATIVTRSRETAVLYILIILLTIATAMSPGDGISINKKNNVNYQRGGISTIASMTVTHAPVGTIRQLPPSLCYSTHP